MSTYVSTYKFDGYFIDKCKKKKHCQHTAYTTPHPIVFVNMSFMAAIIGVNRFNYFHCEHATL